MWKSKLGMSSGWETLLMEFWIPPNELGWMEKGREGEISLFQRSPAKMFDGGIIHKLFE